MNKLANKQPIILEKSIQGACANVSLSIPQNLSYFAGHFPNTPILAGVVQLHWAVEFARELLGDSTMAVQNIEVLKFKAVIVPGQLLELCLEKKANGKVSFVYRSLRGEHASGRIVFIGDV